MAQNVVTFSGDPTGTQLLDTLLTGLQGNSLTTNSGITRPTYAQTGTIWLDITTTPWLLKVFNGTSDIVLGAISTEFALNALAANSIVCNQTGSVANSSTLSLGANKFPARDSTGNLAAKTVTDFALTLLDDIDQAAARTTLGIDAAGNGMTLLRAVEVTSGSPVTTVEFTTGINSTYSAYKLLLRGVRSLTTGFDLILRMRCNGTWYAGGSTAYSHICSTLTGTDETFLNESARDSIFIGPPILSASSNSGISGEVDIFRTPDRKQTVNSRVCDITGSSSNVKFESSGGLSNAANTALDGLRIQFNSGNIAEGGFYLYGLKTA